MGVLVELLYQSVAAVIVGNISGIAVRELTKAGMWPSTSAHLEVTRPWVQSSILERKE